MARGNSLVELKGDEEKKREWDKWRWAILGTAIPAGMIFIAQAVIFFFKFVPIMVSLAP